MAKLTGDIIKAGMSIWISKNKGKKIIPVELMVVTGIVESHQKLRVIYINEQDVQTCAASTCYNNNSDDYGNYYIYLGDKGVRPYEYDSRPTQVFTTREELKAAIIELDGENPNFLEGE